MKKILAQPNKEKTAFFIPSTHSRALLLSWLKKYKWFEIIPRSNHSRKAQAFLEAAVIPAWGKFNYGLDPRNPETIDKARELFKQDFHYEIVKDKNGNPRKIGLSLKDEHTRVLEKYNDYAAENGAPIPNPELFKMWRDKYSHDERWANFYDWLDAIKLDVDSMPSREVFAIFDKEYA
jgi:hypothetical protein